MRLEAGSYVVLDEKGSIHSSSSIIDDAGVLEGIGDPEREEKTGEVVPEVEREISYKDELR